MILNYIFTEERSVDIDEKELLKKIIRSYSDYLYRVPTMDQILTDFWNYQNYYINKILKTKVQMSDEQEDEFYKKFEVFCKNNESLIDEICYDL